MRRFDSGKVMVLGNGPVGQTAALLLARWGIPVTILDARAERDPIGSKAICQQRDVLEIWESVGVGKQVAEEGVTWDMARTFYQDKELFAQPFRDKGQSPFPPFVNISQTRTEELLAAKIAAEPLIEEVWGHEIVSIAQDERSVTVTCRLLSGETAEIVADYAIAALGSKARELRRQLGVTFGGRSFEDKFLICDIRTDMPGWATERRFYFDPEWNPGRQVLVHPCPDSTFRIDWQVPGDYDLEAEEASGALDARIRQVIGDKDYEIVWKSVYRFHARLASRMRVGRVLLAGDCAHIVSPFGARGLNSGVGDAENAAWKLTSVLRGNADEALLESYDVERRAAAIENLEVTEATMDFLVPQNEEQLAERLAKLERAIGDPAASTYVDSGRLAEPFWYVDSPLTTPDPDRPFTGRPPKGEVPDPVPGVLMPDVPVTVPGIRADRIRELARYGILLLTGPEVDTESVRRTALDAITSPLRIHRLEDIDATGLLGQALRPGPCDVWIVRPDSHISAVVDGADPRALREALRNTIAAPGSEAARVLAAREVPPGPPLPPREPAGPAGRKEPVTA
ncbi:oxidoreductase [Kocuria dechangensis]|uniref:Oxidoreductase n=1 Tax=Kocuria dechangensis TaxID=1176249 RepID=A0A917LP60_9MICC|nr:FAD-dependent monooxygenase [Kocuria dechangensis]GGG48769.1 oxidoreductase [Kocuria dechangensis]